ncbi:MAG: polysaccharide deacetylase family protein [Polyangiales bacterium]
MPSVSWKLRLLCCVLAIVGGGSLVGASEVGPQPLHGAFASIRPARNVIHEPVHAEPGPQLLEQVAMVGQPDVTGDRFPSGLTIQGGTRRRMILFTFDDGPSKRTTPHLLDVLDELGIKALFFLTSESFGNGNPWEREHAEIVRDIVRRGHMVGNHTETHRQLPLLNNAEIEAELARSGRKIAWAAGSYPRLIRPPGGAMSKRVEWILAENGYTSVMWAVYPADLEEQTPEGVVRTFFRVLDRREQDTGDRGGIILMHDTKPLSLRALPRIVEALERRNCTLLARGEELYDIVGDLGYFIPGYELDESLEDRQAALREDTAKRCGSVALVD